MNIQKDNEMYMRIALITAERSYARRLKVGCVIVKNRYIVFIIVFCVSNC